MLDQLFRPGRRRFLLSRIRANLLAEEFEGFAQYLSDRRHSHDVILQYLRAVEHLGTWLRSRRIRTIASLDERAVASFLQCHLPCCRCPRPSPRQATVLRAAVGHFLRVLRLKGRISRRVEDSSSIGKALREFNQHLIDTCGLATSTRNYRHRYVCQFLKYKFGHSPIRPSQLKARDLMEFVADRARECKPGSVQMIAASLRSYLKFLVMRGLCPGGLIHAVPRIPSWRLSHIPKTMSKEDLCRFLSSIKRSTAKGRRDYAMALCLADLGLRSSEVSEIRLDNINWREASLTIASSKTRRERVLPLPRRLAKAIAGYLRGGRPRTIQRRLFLTHRTRPGLPIDAHMVCRAMASAYRQSGAKTPWAGPHVLRHTVATAMLEGGARMKDLADVLGHASIDTSAIYAKVNLRMLSPVAMPWPEVRS